jgi:hypothetical protein
MTRFFFCLKLHASSVCQVATARICFYVNFQLSCNNMCCYKDDIMTYCDSKSVSNMFGKPGNDKISLAVAVFYKFLSTSSIITDLRNM